MDKELKRQLDNQCARDLAKLNKKEATPLDVLKLPFEAITAATTWGIESLSSYWKNRAAPLDSTKSHENGPSSTPKP